MPRPYVKGKMRKDFRMGIKKPLLETSKYVDAGELEVIAALKDVPESKTFESQPRQFGCIPWHLKLTRLVEPVNIDPAKPNNFIKVSLKCGFETMENTPWTAKASGVLVMEKWPEKVKGLDDDEKVSKYREKFSQKFNNQNGLHHFQMKFPIPTRSRSFGAAADSPYLRNGQFKFRLEICIHNVRKVYFPVYDFMKKTPMCNAIIKVVDKKNKQVQVHRYHVNKEYLSMHSPVLERMFDNPNFIEGQTNEVEFKDIDPPVVEAFLSLVYPSRQRPNVKFLRGLLEFARCYFIPMVTAICEQRLLATEEKEMSAIERLKLADDYSLYQVKSNIMQNLKYEKLGDDFDGLSSGSLQNLLRKQKLQQEMKEAKEAEEKAKKLAKTGEGVEEHMDVDQQPTSSSSSKANQRDAGTSGGGGGRGRRSHRRN